MLSPRLLAAAIAVTTALLLPAAAEAGTFGVQNGILVFTGEGSAESIAGFETSSSIRLTRFAGPELGGGPGCNVVDGGQTVDCPKGAISSVRLDLDAGDDVAAVSTAVTVPVTFNGGDGNDGLFGGGGIDTFRGGAGADNVISRDGRAEIVDCGSGNDTAISDDADTRTSCEQIEGDADGDGVRRPADCDDTNPGIRPGAADVPDDGIDQDCSGPMRRTSTSTATASRARRTATTATLRSTPARGRCAATPSTRTAMRGSSRSPASAAASATPGRRSGRARSTSR